MSEPSGAALMAEFDEPEVLLAALRRVVAAGYVVIEVYGPTHIEGLAEQLPDPPRPRIGWWSCVGGLLGGLTMFGFQVWAMVIDWPIDVGGRALFSWPAFLVPTFECVILAAALTAVVALLVTTKLPCPHHPVFNLAAFERASDARFFLSIGVEDPRFDPIQTRALLEQLDPLEIHELPD